MENTEIKEELIKTMVISVDEYRELLMMKGRYEELKDICNNKLTSPILRPDAQPLHHPWAPGVRGGSVTYDSQPKFMEEQNENHIPGV